jgi:hypothetical protein
MAQEIYHRSEWGNPNEQWGNVYLNADLTNELYKRASEYENSWVTDQLLNGVGTKPSIILTPTAYEDGVLNSVKPAKTFGSELVTNGTFDTDSNWTATNSTISISNGVCQVNPTATFGYLNSTSSFQTSVGKKYVYSFDCISRTGSGNVYLQIGTFQNGNNVTNQNIGDIEDNTSYNITFTATSTTSYLRIGFGGSGTSATIDNVSVKEVIDADFDFTRGSSATRVNELGLVQDVQLLSGELVQNGNFEQIGSEQIVNGSFDTDSDWSEGGGWDIIGGKATALNVNGSYLVQNVNLINTKVYKIQFTISDYVSGDVRVRFSGGAGFVSTDYVSGNNTHTLYLQSIGNTVFRFQGQNNFTASIDNVSVKEVDPNDWWDIYETGSSTVTFTDVASINIDGSNSNAGLYQENVFENNKTYKIVLTMKATATFDAEILETQSAAIETTIGDVNLTTSYQDFIFYFTATGTNDLFIHRKYGQTDGQNQQILISNVSVVEITDDTDLPRINYTNFDYEDVLGDELVTNGTFDSDSGWTKGTGWSIANGRASYDGTGGTSFIRQNDVIEVGKTYKVTLEVLANEGSGINTIFLGGTVLNSSHLSVGSYTFYGSTNNTSVTLTIYGRSGEVFEIDNVSVKEITYDVVVPYSGEGSLKLEPQSTNLITYSEDYSQSVWSKFGVTESVSDIISPDGTQNASLITIATSTPYLGYIFSLTQGTTYTVSCFVKKGTNRWVRLANVSSTSTGAWFDLENGVVGTVNSISASIEDYGNGWYRIQNNFVAQSGNNTFFGLSDTDNNTNSSGIGKTAYIWGFQIEQLSYATSYIPTNGSTVTRLADVCNNSGSSDLINSTSGVLYAEISALANDNTYRLMSISDGTTANRIVLGYSNGSNLLLVQVFSSGVSQVNFTYSISDITLYNKIALLYKSNEVTIWVNGVKGTSDISASMPIGLSEFNLNYTYSLPLYGNVKCLAVFKEALSDTELQKLTTI